MKESRANWMGSRFLAHVSLGAMLIVPGHAFAQQSGTTATADDSDVQVEDIVVTAKRTETNLQTTSAAVSAFSATTIENAQIKSVDDVSRLVPNLTFSKSNNEQQISLRGIGVDNAFFTAEAGVAIYIDGVYLGRPNIATATLSDLERIEVVRGPQGTLFGRNATGGAVNIITQGASDEFGGKLYGAYGNYDAFEIGGTVAGPLGAGVSGRLSANYSRHDGYATNLLDGSRLDANKDFSLRGALEFEATDRLKFDLRGDYQHISSTGPVSQPYDVNSTAGDLVVQQTLGGGRFVNRPRTVFHDLSDSWTREYYGGSLTATYDLDWATLKSITAYRHSFTTQNADLDGTDGVVDTIHNIKGLSGLRANQFSEEVQLASDGSGAFNYILGLYYYGEDARVRVVTDQFDFAGFTGVIRTDYTVKQSVDTAAAYGELYFNPTEALRFTAGLRYTSDRKSYSSTIGSLIGVPSTGKNTDRSWTPKLGIEYQFSDDIFGYVTVSRGFKAGGFNPYTNSGFYKPESLWSYEAGLKTQFFDKKLQANAAVFYYDYTDIQVTQYTFLGPDIANVGSAKIKGAELELRIAPVRGLRFDGSVSYLHARYGNFNVTDLLTGVPTNVDGNQVTKSPDWSLSGGVDYSLDLGSGGKLDFRYDISYKSGFYFSVFNTPGSYQEKHALQNAKVTYTLPSGDLQISGFIKNIANKAVFVQATQASAFLFPVVAYNPPRTYGISFTKTF